MSAKPKSASIYLGSFGIFISNNVFPVKLSAFLRLEVVEKKL